ncbi:uncharacterized protein [Primulina eburnea]|uniref:uncharacterized protein n=1 Tax=Primulina eburnea TaxID=1245227 RepID=UPI003C6CA769
MDEKETNLKVKFSRSDNGGEYEDDVLKKYCAQNGIKMEKIIPGTPQQNDVAEMMNMTLNERARSMRLHSGFMKSIWADNVNIAEYLIKRGPSVPLDCRIHEDVWSGKEVNISFLKVFGCLSYVHIDSANRTKLDPNQRSVSLLVMVIMSLVIEKGEPETYGEEMKNDDSTKLELAMKDEMNSLSSNQKADHCCYVKKFDDSYIILLLYVDDMLIAGAYLEEIDKLKIKLSKEFAMKDLGAAKQILGIRILRDRVNVILKFSQEEYVKKTELVFHRSQNFEVLLHTERAEYETRRWLELLKDYDCGISYHPDKDNVVDDTLSMKNTVITQLSLQRLLQKEIQRFVLAVYAMAMLLIFLSRHCSRC